MMFDLITKAEVTRSISEAQAQLGLEPEAPIAALAADLDQDRAEFIGMLSAAFKEASAPFDLACERALAAARGMQGREA